MGDASGSIDWQGFDFVEGGKIFMGEAEATVQVSFFQEEMEAWVE
jgi:hypothetical protein